MRFHVLSIPQVRTTREYFLCGFCPKIVYFCNMMTELGHEVILYGSEENEAKVAENVVCITKAEQKKWLGNVEPWAAAWTLEHDMWREMNNRQIGEISRRKRSREYICSIGGGVQRAVGDAHPDLRFVEFGVGYEGVFCDAVVWESHSWRQFCYGKHGATEKGRWWDTTIYGYINIDDYPICLEKDDYLLYCGRMIQAKGLDIAIKTAERTKLPLIMIGPVNPGHILKVPSHVDYRGVVSIEEKARLMGKARALLTPSLYVEPFGTVVAEAMACGTPVIATNWGSFPEIIPPFCGLTCSSLSQFVQAVEVVKTLDHNMIAEYAKAVFSTETAKIAYQSYFERLETRWNMSDQQVIELPL